MQTLKAKKQGFYFFANFRELKKNKQGFYYLQTLKAKKQEFWFCKHCFSKERGRKNEHGFSFLEGVKVRITRISIFLQTKNAQTRIDL